MANAHSKSFFGQTTGLIISSSSKEDDFIFLKCLKKKGDGTWEKLSRGEGKTIKCSLDEIVMMLQVLKRKISNWNSYHTYKDTNTQINFNWKEESGKKIVWIRIGDYSKMLTVPQIEILKLLLEHLLKEKIKHATGPGVSISKKYISNGTEIKQKRLMKINENYNKGSKDTKTIVREVKHLGGSSSRKMRGHGNEANQIEGTIKGETEKALLIKFLKGDESWIPKSTINPDYEPAKEISQTFLIDNWVLKKNKIIT